MNKIVGLVSSTCVVVLGLVGSAYAKPSFLGGSPDHSMAVDDFLTDAAVFNKQDVADLKAAKHVVVFKLDDAWAGTNANAKANSVTDKDSQAIGELVAALKADPKAMAVLKDGKITPDSVVDIVGHHKGDVWIYVK